jgi:hypothetical protein
MTGVRLRYALAPLAASTLLLAGCMQLTMGLTVNPDDTIDGQLLLTADKSVLENGGRTAAQGFADMRKNIPAMPAGPEEVYEDADRYGTRITYHGTPLAEFTTQSIKLVKDGGTYRFTLSLDPQLYGSTPATTAQSRADFLKAMEFAIQVTFPGTVIDSNGSAVGRTVTWKIKSGQDKPTQLIATAAIAGGTPALSGTGTKSGSAVPWLLIADGAAVLAVMAVAVLLLMRRSGPPATAEAPHRDSAPTSGAG